MEALIAGQRDPWSLARLAKGTRAKRLSGSRRRCASSSPTIMSRPADDAGQHRPDRRPDRRAGCPHRGGDRPFLPPAAQLADIPGVNTVAAAELIAEIGVDMARFPTAAHLVSWAKFCPQPTSRPASPAARPAARATPGWPAPSGGSCSAPRAPTPSWVPDRRLARRRGKPKAIVAVGNSVLTVVYHLLSDADLDFCDLGPAHYESRINKHRRARDLATQLQALTGQHIVIRDGKAIITDNAAYSLRTQHIRLRRMPSACPLTIRFSGQTTFETAQAISPRAGTRRHRVSQLRLGIMADLYGDVDRSWSGASSSSPARWRDWRRPLSHRRVPSATARRPRPALLTGFRRRWCW